MSTVSVIIPLYNKEKCIASTVQSVLNQTYTDFELIIVNDGSTDNSLKIISQIHDERIKILDKTNGGVSSARNYGAQNALSNWIIFLDADDIMLPCNINLLVTLQQKYKTDIVSGNYIRIFPNNKERIAISYNKEYIIKNNLKALCLNQFSLRTGCALIRKVALLKYPFPEILSRYEDLCSILELCNNYTIAVSPIPILKYTYEYSSLSAITSNKYKDFTFNFIFAGKRIWEKIIYGELLLQSIHTYPNDQVELRNKYHHYYYYKYVAWGIRKLKSFTNIINKLKKIE